MLDRYNKLIGFFAEHDIKHKEVAEMLGITVASFSNKINRNNGADFNAKEMRAICKNYKLSADRFFLI